MMENPQDQNQQLNEQQKPQGGEKREVFPHILSALKERGNTSGKNKKHSSFGALDPKEAMARRANQAKIGNSVLTDALSKALQNRRNQVLDNQKNRDKIDPDNKKTKEEKEEDKVKKENGQSDGKEDKDNAKDGSGKKKKSKPNLLNRDDAEEEDDEESSGFNFFKRKKHKNPVTAAIKGFIRTQVIPLLLGALVSILFLILLILIPVVAISSVVNAFSFDKEVSDAKGDSDISDTDPGDSEDSDDLDDTNKNLISLIDTKYSSEDKTQLGRVVHAVEFVFLSYQDDKVYEELTEDELDEVANIVVASKDGSGTYNLETLKTKLAQEFFPSKLPNYTTDDYEAMAQEVLDYLDEYQEIIGEDTNSSDTTSSGGMCGYNLTRIHYEDKMITANINPSNIKVRLMQATSCGGTTGQPLAGEELVDFEKYVLGVAYAEIGDGAPEEAFKAQLVVARNFALTNSIAKARNSLKQENGQWIMEITNCNADQYYCDPDKGCYYYNPDKNSYLITGTPSGRKQWKTALAQDAPQRQWANEVIGKVYVDNSNQLIWTNFTNSTQETMKSYARSGMDYTSILLSIFPSGSKVIGSTCTSSVGNYTSWKQTDAAWGKVVLGGGTDSDRSIGKIGCLVTSIAMLIEKSGVLSMSPLPTMVSAATFNPGTFAQALNNVNTFDSGGSLTDYRKVTQVVPKFVYQSIISLDGLSQTDKLNKISSTLNQGLYCTAHVISRSGTHFVALDTVEGNTIKMFDPGSNATNMWQAYDYEETDKIVCFKVE
mgnify:CR=1 FL=1